MNVRARFCALYFIISVDDFSNFVTSLGFLINLKHFNALELIKVVNIHLVNLKSYLEKKSLSDS